MKNNPYPIVDLHCDLLSYLIDKEGRSIYDPFSRSSHPQLLEGGVKLQTLAVGAFTASDCTVLGQKQIHSFQHLLQGHGDSFAPFTKESLFSDDSLVHIIPAFENASAFAKEDEPLANALARLQKAIDTIGPFFYISLTWDQENRFGGGVASQVGLKEDGKKLLEYLSGKKIAVDFSHTSDKLAFDILDYIDKHRLNVPLLASHSNYRAITSLPRNLPRELAQELIHRNGIIGLNFFAPFVNKADPTTLAKHVDYALSLGGENALCFGADFFCSDDFPQIRAKYQTDCAFFPELSDSSSYPYALDLLRTHLSLKEETLKKITSENALRFLRTHIL